MTGTSEFNWAKAAGLRWKLRNQAVEAALRAFLARRPASETISTKTLAEGLWPGGSEDGELQSILRKLAPWMGRLATHDGEVFKLYGKVFRRWRWHGQAEAT